MVNKDFFDVNTWYVQNEEALKANAAKTSVLMPIKPPVKKGKQSAFHVNNLQEKANELLEQVTHLGGKKDTTQKKKSFVRKMLDL